MTYTVLVVLQGYREWTESLGNDREWLIQLIQSRTYEVVQSVSKDFDGIALPMRYDVQLALVPPDINIEEFVGTLREALGRYAPTPVTIKACCGEIPEVITECSKSLSEDFIGRCESYEALVVAHADLNYFTRFTEANGVLNAYHKIINYVSVITDKLRDKAYVQYLGGDNVVALTSLRNLESVVELMTSFDDVKVGVGVSLRPRKAFSKAAEALSILRSEGRIRRYLVLYDEELEST